MAERRGQRVGMGVPVGDESRGVERVVLRLELRGDPSRRADLHRRCQRVDSTGGVNANAVSATAIGLDSELERDEEFFAAAGSFPSRVQVLRSGRYRVTSAVVLASASGAAAAMRGFVAKNGVTGSPIEGSESGACVVAASGARMILPASMIVDLAANDYVEAYTIRIVGTVTLNTVAGGSSITVELLEADEVPTPRLVVDRFLRIEGVRASKGTSGSSGTTTLDVLVNGVSILASPLLQLDYSEAWVSEGPSLIASADLGPSDEVTLDVIDEESPAPRDIVVELLCAVA